MSNLDDVIAAQAVDRVWALVNKWENTSELSSGPTHGFAAEVRKALEGK